MPSARTLDTNTPTWGRRHPLSFGGAGSRDCRAAGGGQCHADWPYQGWWAYAHTQHQRSDFVFLQELAWDTGQVSSVILDPSIEGGVAGIFFGFIWRALQRDALEAVPDQRSVYPVQEVSHTVFPGDWGLWLSTCIIRPLHTHSTERLTALFI